MVTDWLKHRRREPELMDQPDLDVELHHGALAGLSRVNAISGTIGQVWKPISQFAKNVDRPIRVLDVASGGGDLAIGLAERARRESYSVSVDGCDFSDVAIDYAQKRSDACNADVRFLKVDVLRDAMPEGYDVVCCSLFLHHFDPPEVISIMKSMRECAGGLIVASDLLRSRLGYVMCWSGIRILTRSRICHVDGPLSVQPNPSN